MACNTRMCGPCDRDGEEIDALSWCETCSEGLCQNCLKEHKKNRASLNHKVKHVEHLTKEYESVLSLNDLCEKHAGKTISLYCVSHDQLCCSSCLHADHSQCADIISIEDAAKGSTQSTALEDLQARIEDTFHIFDFILKEKNENINDLEAQAKMRETEILRTKKSMMDQLNKAEISAKELMNRKKESCIKQILEETDHIKATQFYLKSSLRDLKAVKQSSSEKQIFIKVKQLDIVQHILEQELKKSREILLKKYELKNSHLKPDLKSFASLFGESTIATSVMEAVPKLKKIKQCQIPSSRDGVLQLVKTINQDNNFSGMRVWKLCYFEQHDKVAITATIPRVYVVDLQSKRVETIDIQKLGTPWYIDKYDDNHAMVAVNQQTSLVKLNVLTLNIVGKIHLEWKYKAINEVIRLNDHIVIRDYIDQSFVILKNGLVLRKIPTDMPTAPGGYMCGLGENKIIYSSYYDSTVGCFTLKGQQVFPFIPIEGPMGIAVDKNNFIYVGTQNNGIQKITPEGKSVTTVLSDVRLIKGMTYKQSTHELIFLADDGLQFYKIK